MIARYSSVIAPRSAKGTPRASNSSRSHPTPAPKMTRPPERRSRVESIFACAKGLRSGTTTTVVPSFTRVVSAAA